MTALVAIIAELNTMVREAEDARRLVLRSSGHGARGVDAAAYTIRIKALREAMTVVARHIQPEGRS